MKLLIVSILVFTTSLSFAQSKQFRYIQLIADDRFKTNLRILVNNIPKNRNGEEIKDSLIDNTKITSIIYKLQNPVLVLNELGKDGWELVSTFTLPDIIFDGVQEFSIYYYLKKEFIATK
jgi:hypothetical protein